MPESLQIVLQNQSNSDSIYAYITGLAIQHQNARVVLKSNGKDLYFPKEPSRIGSPLLEDCAIPLGPPGNTVRVTIPQIAGGRIWFSRGDKLTFLLNPGPALVEPSVLNPSDPNASVDFGFCEFTLNNDQLFANISYVDFVSALPIALSLECGSGHVQRVSGMDARGIDGVAEGLRSQSQRDQRPWNKLIVPGKDGEILRILNPTHGSAVGGNFDGYYEPYVDQVWQKYADSRMKINTQAAAGVVDGSINHKGELVIGNEVFSKPNTADVLGCNSGPFTTGPSPDRNAIIPRLAAAFARSTLLDNHEHPSDAATHYRSSPTNHYARIVHENNIDRKGYAFAYDDVQPDGGADQSGKVNDACPRLFTVAVGGCGHHASDREPDAPDLPQRQVTPGETGSPQGQGSDVGKEGSNSLRGLTKRMFKH